LPYRGERERAEYGGERLGAVQNCCSTVQYKSNE
jgi:hypothetical protein